MFKIALIFTFIATNSFAQDTLTVDDGSIWWTKSSCSVDYRCYENIDDLVEAHCSDSVTILSIELVEKVYENAKETYTDCRVKRLSDYLRGKHSIEVNEVQGSPDLVDIHEMRQAIQEQNYREIIFVFGPKKEMETL